MQVHFCYPHCLCCFIVTQTQLWNSECWLLPPSLRNPHFPHPCTRHVQTSWTRPCSTPHTHPRQLYVLDGVNCKETCNHTILGQKIFGKSQFPFTSTTISLHSGNTKPEPKKNSSSNGRALLKLSNIRQQ